MTGVRMDIWLWAARFFKTRPLAKRACELGRILSNGQIAKAAREVRVGDRLRITNDGGDFQVEVLLLSEVRGPGARSLRRSTGNPTRAGSCARRSPPSGRRCGNLKCCRRGGRRNATGGTSSSSGVEDREALLRVPCCSLWLMQGHSPQRTQRNVISGLDFRLILSQYGVVRHVARGHNGVFATYRARVAHPS